MDSTFLVLYVTFPNIEELQNLAKKLLEQQLATCVNMYPIRSMYRWKGKIENGEEWVALIKTRKALKDKVEQWITEHHSYETPCIASWEMGANPPYMQWIMDETSMQS